MNIIKIIKRMSIFILCSLNLSMISPPKSVTKHDIKAALEDYEKAILDVRQFLVSADNSNNTGGSNNIVSNNTVNNNMNDDDQQQEVQRDQSVKLDQVELQHIIDSLQKIHNEVMSRITNPNNSIDINNTNSNVQASTAATVPSIVSGNTLPSNTAPSNRVSGSNTVGQINTAGGMNAAALATVANTGILIPANQPRQHNPSSDDSSDTSMDHRVDEEVMSREF